MALDLTIDELLTTTRTVRKRLDCDRPVERSVIEECVEIAMQAPSGANSQGWQWLFVEEAGLKQQLAVIYRKQFDVTYRVMPIATHDDLELQAQAVRRRESATWLADNFERVPLIMGSLRGVRDIAAIHDAIEPMFDHSDAPLFARRGLFLESR